TPSALTSKPSSPSTGSKLRLRPLNFWTILLTKADNAQAESLWSRLKTEVLEVRERPVFADLVDAQRSVADYFDYYNHERLHSSIDYHIPCHTHQQLLTLNALNCPA
ncbi:integrase core domain-containing protein, partial [Hymenobacter lapidarius]|uniref:integrase core domain-containing protein n=1 Tax=Hymenobacter lapidarius TaxID=1908237 RepID=UPI00111317C4